MKDDQENQRQLKQEQNSLPFTDYTLADSSGFRLVNMLNELA